MTWPRWRRVRQFVQILFFMLFVVLLFAGLQRPGSESNADHFITGLFFRFNPLSALAAMLSNQKWIPGLVWALVTVGLTLLVGRVWCGWICPLGTLLEWITFRRARASARKISATEQVAPKWRKVKYFLLCVILIAALFGNLSLLIFEPLSLLTRAATTVVIPALNYIVNTSEGALYSLNFMRPAVDWLESILRGPVLPVKQPVFNSPLLIALLFGGVIALNRLADRFWCRYLCPLGALLGWLSKISIFRPVIGPVCTACTRCAIACKPAAIRTRAQSTAHPKGEATHSSTDSNEVSAITILPSECTVCLDCLTSCDKDGMDFAWVGGRNSVSAKSFPDGTRAIIAPPQEFDLSRRQFLQAAVVGAAGVVLARTDLRLRMQNSLLIRPPSVTDEAGFLAKCLRCTECMKICPTTALQPALGEAGLEGLWTPLVMPRVGYCDYGCNACGQVCPSGAIAALTLEEKRQAVIGKASVNRNRCLPWAADTACIVCEEMCPTPEKAIRLEQVTVVTEAGDMVELQRPYVLRDICIGCGICENRCPIEAEAAIRVYSLGI